MGFFVELFTHTQRLFRVQFRHYLIVADLFQVLTFCVMLVIASAQYDYHLKKEAEMDKIRAGSGQSQVWEASFSATRKKILTLWFYPHNNDSESDMNEVVKEMQFINDMKVLRTRFSSYKGVLDMARVSVEKDSSLDSLIVEVRGYPYMDIEYVLSSLHGIHFQNRDVFTFLTGAYSLGLMSVDERPLHCVKGIMSQSSLIDALFFACMVDGFLVAYFIGRERRRYIDNAITSLGGNLGAYVMSWYLQSILKSGSLALLYVPLNYAFFEQRIPLLYPLTFLAFRFIITSSYASASLLIRNSKAAISVTTAWHIHSFYLARLFQCNGHDNERMIYPPHMLITCHCLPIDVLWMKPGSYIRCCLYIVSYYLVFVFLGILSVTSVVHWPHMVADYLSHRAKTCRHSCHVIQEAFLQCDDDVAIEIKSLNKMCSVLPPDCALKVPRLKTTVILDTSGQSRSSLLNQVVGRSYHGWKNVSVKNVEPWTTCMCPRYDFIWDNLTVKEVINTYSRILSYSNPNAETLKKDLVEEFDLESKLDLKVRDLVPVDKKLLSLAVTFLSDAEVLVFDDPAQSLKGGSLSRFVSCFLKRQGQATILMTCSHGEDALRIADRIAVVVNGHIRIFGSVPFVITCLGIGTHIQIKLFSKLNIKQLYLYMLLFAPHCVCLKSMNNEADDEDDTELLTINFFISRIYRKSVEFVILNIRSKKENFGIYKLNISDVGIDTMLDRCSCPLVLEAILHQCHHNAIPIQHVVKEREKEFAQIKLWKMDLEESVKITTMDKFPHPGPWSSLLERTLPAVMPLSSDMSFKDFVKVVTQRYYIRKRSDATNSVCSTVVEATDEGDDDQNADVNENCRNDDSAADCLRKFVFPSSLLSLMNDENDDPSSKSRYSHNGSSYTAAQLKSKVEFPLVLHTDKSFIQPLHLHPVSKQNTDNARNEIGFIDSVTDKNENNLDEPVKRSSRVSTKTDCSYDNGNIARSTPPELREDEECFLNFNNNSNLAMENLYENLKFVPRRKISESTISVPVEDNDDLALYYNLVIWGRDTNRCLQEAAPESERRFNACEPSGFQFFRAHTKALLRMSVCHVWNSLPIILFGFLLALIIESCSFPLTLSKVLDITKRSQVQGIKDFIKNGGLEQNLHRDLRLVDSSSNCNGSSVCGNSSGIHCNPREFVYGYEVLNDSNNVTVYYSEGEWRPLAMAMVSAVEFIQNMRQSLGNPKFVRRYVSVDPMPVLSNERTQFLIRRLENDLAFTTSGVTMASFCLILALTFRFLSKEMFRFEKLLVLSGVSGIFVYVTQFLVCAFVYAVLMALVHLSAYALSGVSGKDLKLIWKDEVVLSFAIVQLTYSAAMFSIITLLLQLSPKRIYVCLWAVFEVLAFGLANLFLKDSWLRLDLISKQLSSPTLKWILVFLSPTTAFTKANYYIVRHAAQKMIVNKIPDKVQRENSCSDLPKVLFDPNNVLCPDALFHLSMMIACVHFMHTLISVVVFVMVYVVKLIVTGDNAKLCKTKMKGKRSYNLKLYGLPVHPRYRDAGKAEAISTTCNPMHCLTLFGNHEDSGASSIIKLIIGHNYYCERKVTIGGNYFPQFRLFGSEQRISIGYCPKKNGLNPVLTGRQVLRLFAQIRTTTVNVDKAVRKTLADVSLTEVADVQVYNYSEEMKRKLHIAIALVGDPPIVLLDHPTKGLDYLSKVRIWDHLIALRQSGQVVVLASDCADECYMLGTHVYVLSYGCIKLDSGMSFLKREASGYFAYAWVAQVDSGTTMPVVRILREIQRRFRSGMFAFVSNEREPYILLSFVNIIPEYDHSKIYYAMEDLKDDGLVRHYMVQEVTPPLVLEAYRHCWLPY